MAQRIHVEGFRTDAPVAPLSELAETLRKWVPSLSDDDANTLLVRAPFDLGRAFSDGEADAAAADLRALGARVRLEPVEDPTWWRDRHGETQFGATATGVFQPPPAPAVHQAPAPPAPAGLWETWNEVIQRPSAFFASEAVVRGRGASPLLFAVVFSTVGAVLSTPGGYVLGSLIAAPDTSLTTSLLTAVISTPFATIIALLIYALGMHVSALMFGGEGGFQVSWRIAAYSTAASVFQAVPVFGYVIMMFLYFLYSIAGLQGGYRMTPVRAAAAATLPLFIMLAFFGLLILFLAIAVGVSGFQHFLDLMNTQSLQGA